jgi:hypothetical protein
MIRTLTVFCAFVAVVVTPAFAQSAIEVQVAIDDRGDPAAEWLEALSAFHDVEGMPDAIGARHPLSERELNWAELIHSRREAWEARTTVLLAPFGSTAPPTTVRIVIGNVGGQDAFAPAPDMIAFDVGRLLEVYGAATKPTNGDRIDRFFDHEYTHLLHKSWQAAHEVDLSTPLRRALWDCLKEGVGNYRSLSDRWKTAEGGLSEHAKSVLEELEPVFVERLVALVTADEAEETELTRDLSMGPFQKKWGALTVALWMYAEAGEDASALARWVEAGPEGILVLAGRHLPADLARRLPSL